MQIGASKAATHLDLDKHRAEAVEQLERELTHTIEMAAAQYLSAYQLEVQIVDVAMAGREATCRS